MKKIISLVIAAIIVVLLVGCSNSSNSNSNEYIAPTAAVQETTVTQTEQPTEMETEEETENDMMIDNDVVESSEAVVVSGEVGEYFTFGSYEQDGDLNNGKEPIEWMILDKQQDHVLLLSRYALDSKRYDDGTEEVTWETCTVRKWLNNDFLQAAFSQPEQGAIAYSQLENKDATNLFGNGVKGGVGGNNTIDKVFLLSVDEVRRYFKETGEGHSRKVAYCEEYVCYPTQYALDNGVEVLTEKLYKEYNDYDYPKDIVVGGCNWILRSPGFNNKYCANVGTNLTLDESGSQIWNTTYTAVRPAIWVKVN